MHAWDYQFQAARGVLYLACGSHATIRQSVWYSRCGGFLGGHLQPVSAGNGGGKVRRFSAAIVSAAACIMAMQSAVGARIASAQMAIGMNLAAPSDWGRAWVFKDQMRQARWFEKNQWWLVQWGHDKYPAGRWVCEWEGDDAPKFARGVATESIDQVLPGLAIIDVTPTKGIAIQPFGDTVLTHLWMPGVRRDGSPFHPEYVESLRPFKVLRFMDWQATNSSLVSDWSQRRFVDAQQQWMPNDSQGVAIEYCIDLANEVDADPWLCIPHLATDDFVEQLAILIRDRLKPGLVAYLEWGNEIAWNGAAGFKGGQWLRNLSQTTGVRAVDYYGGRVKKISQIVRPILGDRVRVVVAGQAANPWIARKECEAAGMGNFDAVSCAWYFGVGRDFVGTDQTTADQILEACQADIVGRMFERLVAHKKIADIYGVSLVCYEGGQHLTAGGKDVPHAAALLAAQRHPRMGELYRLALSKCREAGVTLAVHFNDVSPPGKYGAWGARESMTDYQSPKWQALLEEAGN
jgi:hypothetical protein